MWRPSHNHAKQFLTRCTSVISLKAILRKRELQLSELLVTTAAAIVFATERGLYRRRQTYRKRINHEYDNNTFDRSS